MATFNSELPNSQLPNPKRVLIRGSDGADFDAMLRIINTEAEAYHGVIPVDCSSVVLADGRWMEIQWR